MFLNRSTRGHTGLKIKEIFGQKQFWIQSKVGLSLFLFNPSFRSPLFLFFSVAFFRGMLVSTIFQKKKFSFLGLFRFMAPDFFCFCFSAAKVSNGRLLLYFLCSDLVLFAHLIESSIIFRRPGKKFGGASVSSSSSSLLPPSPPSSGAKAFLRRNRYRHFPGIVMLEK